MKFLSVFAALLVATPQLLGQVKTNVAPAHRECATHQNHIKMMGMNPEYAVRQAKLEKHTASFVEARQQARANGAQLQPVVVTIPVVFHVIYANSTQNIPDSEILEQLQVLNDDFRRTNADQDNIWPQAADTEIEFCLATRDPNGAPSDGILRVPTTVSSFGANDAMKFSSSGGSDAWPADEYLNFWVCNLGGGLLGYAQFPGGNPDTDGVVCGYPYVGIDGPGSGAYNLGRTGTHEVGHWLNLRHIWGDGPCGTDDLVADTPESDGPNYGCALGHVSCSTEDMVQNYMDYSDDGCMNVFSQGQGDRMQATFAPGGSRAGLLSSNGCLPAVPDFDLDAAIVAVNAPSGFSCATDVTPSITLFNFGGDTLTSATITYDVDGGTPMTFSWSGVLEFGQTDEIVLPTLTPGDGAHVFNVAVSAPNGGVDENPANDSGSSNFNLDSQGVDVTMTLTLDNYPGETTWNITDAGGSVVLAGGPYAGSGTVVETSCIPQGCFTLTVFDSFGDGMCCAYGTGGYEFSAGGAVLASGGEFGASESTDFCVGDGFGCTDSTACNFDPDATVDNGACDFSCYGCTDPTSCNYNPDATIDDGSCLGDGFGITVTIITDSWPEEITWNITDSLGAVVLSGGPYGAAATTYVESDCLGAGCFTFNIFDSFGDGIFSPGGYTLTVDTVTVASGGAYGSGESVAFCTDNLNFGCTDPTACNYDAGAGIDNGSCDYSCLGCTIPEACNYNSTATVDDGSCLFNDDCGVCGGDNSSCSGCTDSTACNFDPSAILDDGSCILDGLPFTLTILLDNYPGEVTWAMTDSLGATVASGGPYSTAGATVEESFCAGEGCYTFTMFDSFGDGICCSYGIGNYTLVADGGTVASGGEYGASESTTFCVGGGFGCTDATACNYDPDATDDNGACDFSCYGCTDPGACNYDPDATIDDGSCISGGVGVVVTIITDSWPEEITWNITDSTGTQVASGGPYGAAATTYEEIVCLDEACFTFNIADSFGDGIYSPGGYSITIDGVVIASGGAYGFGESVAFCTDNLNFGCTDATACNYDPDAGIDDGSCDYSCNGCTIPEACNYNPDATVDDGSCLFNDDCGVCGGDNSSCGGCTDPAACNYDPDATIDDGSCIIGGLDFTMTVVLDNYPSEFSWVLTNASGTVVASEGYSGLSGTVTTTYCLPDGCYDLTVNDSFGDGICCAYGNGSYTLTVAGSVVATGGDFGSTETTNFCTGDLPGCTDPDACNYNSAATVDDGSCTYPAADNLDCDGNCLNDADGDGICDEDELAESSFVQLGYDVVGQNTVDGATTYRVWVELADPTEQLVAVYGFDSVPLTINTTTAFYQNPLGGALATNYNPALLPIDSLLAFDSWLTVGGEDNTADVNTIGLDFGPFEGSGGNIVADDVNGGSVFIYPDLEPAAFPDDNGHVLIAQLTTDGEVSMTVNLQTRRADGENPQILQQSLTFQEVYECFGDFNNDGLIGIGVLLMLLGDFGCPSDCSFDMNGDGGVTTSDMLVMLAVFGTDCP